MNFFSQFISKTKIVAISTIIVASKFYETFSFTVQTTFLNNNSNYAIHIQLLEKCNLNIQCLRKIDNNVKDNTGRHRSNTLRLHLLKSPRIEPSQYEKYGKNQDQNLRIYFPNLLLWRNYYSKQSSSLTSKSSLSVTRFKNFDEMLKSHSDRVVLVDFHARWCGPCRIHQNELQIVKDNLGGTIKVFNVDMEKFPSVGTRFSIDGLPTLLLFKGGEEVHRFVGVILADELINKVKEYVE